MSDDLLPRFVIGLGANLGDRLATLGSAVRALAGAGAVLRVSPIYETQAVGPPQPDYLNAAVLLASPSAGQNRAETTAPTRSSTRNSSPEVSPNMSLA